MVYCASTIFMVWNKADVCMLEVEVLGIEGYVLNLNWVVWERKAGSMNHA